MPEPFASPDDLLHFAVETADQLREADEVQAGDELEAAARFPAATGGEWQGVLGTAASRILRDEQTPDPIKERLRRIVTAWRA